MASNPNRITIAQNAHVYAAALGSLAPVDEVVALDPAWRDVGLFMPESLNFTDTPAFGTTMSHQSNYPTRRFQTSESAAVAVDLQEFSAKNTAAVLGGGSITQVSAGHFRYAPAQVGARADISVILEIIDGIKRYRLIVPRCTATEAVALSFKRAGEVLLPLRLAVVGTDVGDPWYMLSSDAAFDPAAV